MKRQTLLFAIALLAGGSAAAAYALDLDPASYRFERPVVVEEGDAGREGDALVSIEVDPHLFAETVADFADLRLVREREGEVREWPFRVDRLSPPPAPPELRSSATRVVSFETREDGSLSMVLEAAERDFPADRIEISTPLRDFEKTLEVAGSDDGETWEVLVPGALIVDQQRFVDFRRTAVDLPQSRHRYYRLEIDEASDEQRSALREMTRSFSEAAGSAMEERSRMERRDFRIDSVRLVRDPEAAAADSDRSGRRGYPAELLSIEEDAENRRTVILVATAKAPVSEVVFETPDRNFRRSVEVLEALGEGPAGQARWRTVGRGTIHRYAIEGLSEEQLAIRFEERRSARLRLLVANLDSAPLEIEDLTVAGPPYAVRFLAEAQPGDRWTLRYGGAGDSGRPPRYDLAALTRALDSGAPVEEWSLGDPEENPSFSPVVATTRWWNHPSALLAMVVAAVALLVVLLLRAGRSVAEIEEGEP